MCSVCTDDRSTSGSTKDLCLTQLRKKSNCRNDFFSVLHTVSVRGQIFSVVQLLPCSPVTFSCGSNKHGTRRNIFWLDIFECIQLCSCSLLVNNGLKLYTDLNFLQCLAKWNNTFLHRFLIRHPALCIKHSKIRISI